MELQVHTLIIENIRLKKVKSVKNVLLQSTHKNWVGRGGCQIKNLMNSRDPIRERENKSVFTERTNTFYIQTCTLTQFVIRALSLSLEAGNKSQAMHVVI